MGFFSFFSKEYEEDDEELTQEQEAPVRQYSAPPEAALTGELFEGMRVEVMTRESEPLLSARIAEYTADTLTLKRLPGELAFKVCPLGASVSISGYDKRLIPICLSAVVEESGRTQYKLKNLKIENHSENRDTFRLPFTAPVSLYHKEDDHYKNPEDCQLVNISTGGCCVQSEYIHMEDEVLRIRVKLEDYAPLNFLGQVVRCVEHAPGQFRYGILFAQLTEQEITTLNKTLYNLQMGIKETRIRTSEDRSW